MDMSVDCETITRLTKPNNYVDLLDHAVIKHHFDMVDHLLDYDIIIDNSLLIESLYKGIHMIMHIHRRGRLTTMMNISELLKNKLSHRDLKILLDNHITTLNESDYEDVFNLCINRNLYYHLKILMKKYPMFHEYCNDITRLMNKRSSGECPYPHTITWLIDQNKSLLSKTDLLKFESSKVVHEMRRQHFYADKRYSLHYHCVHGNVDIVKSMVAKMKKLRK